MKDNSQLVTLKTKIPHTICPIQLGIGSLEGEVLPRCYNTSRLPAIRESRDIHNAIPTKPIPKKWILNN